MAKSYKDNLELKWSLWEMFQLDNVSHLRSALESRVSQIKQTEWDIFYNWHAEDFKSLFFN